MRAFIGIRVRPTPEILGLLKKLGSLNCGKTVEPENLHVNLAFLGEITLEKAQAAGRSLASLAGFGAFEMRLQGVSAFPSEGAPRVVWVGAHAPELSRLHAAIASTLASHGFPAEREFKPHVTLLRVRQKNLGLEKAFSTKSFGSQRVDKISLIESKLSKTGSVYIDVHETLL